MRSKKFFRFVCSGGSKIVLYRTPSHSRGWPCGFPTRAPFENGPRRANIGLLVFVLVSAKPDRLCQRRAEFLNNWANWEGLFLSHLREYQLWQSSFSERTSRHFAGKEALKKNNKNLSFMSGLLMCFCLGGNGGRGAPEGWRRKTDASTWGERKTEDQWTKCGQTAVPRRFWPFISVMVTLCPFYPDSSISHLWKHEINMNNIHEKF